MANEILSAFRNVFADGISSEPIQPSKYRIREEVGGTIQRELDNALDLAQGAAAGYVVGATWTELAATPGTRAGQPGRVMYYGEGTHTDPVTGQIVNNHGEFRWSTSPAGWRRVGDVIDPPTLRAEIAEEVEQREALIVRTTDDGWLFCDGSDNIIFRLTLDGSIQLPFASISGADPLRDFSVYDKLGNVVFAVQNGVTMFTPSGQMIETLRDALFSVPDLDFTPLFGNALCAFSDLATEIYPRNMLQSRADGVSFVASFLAEASEDGSKAPVAMTTSDALSVRLSDASAVKPALLLLRNREEGSLDRRMAMNIDLKVAPAGSSDPVRVMMIGDSITNRQMGAWVRSLLNARGYVPTFVGTVNGQGLTDTTTGGTGGPVGEGREGWEFGDFTNQVNDRAAPVAPGSETSYLAGSKNDKLTFNPFLRAATGGDPATIVRNGYVFDPAFYLTRFSYVAPNVVFLGLGTNDIRDRNGQELVDGVLDGLQIMVGQLRSAMPDADIVVWFPPAPTSSDRNELWASDYVPVLKTIIKFVKDDTSGRVHLAPTWALANTEESAAWISVEDPDTGTSSLTISDAVHLGPTQKQQVAKNLAAWAACSIKSLL